MRMITLVSRAAQLFPPADPPHFGDFFEYVADVDDHARRIAIQRAGKKLRPAPCGQLLALNSRRLAPQRADSRV